MTKFFATLPAFALVVALSSSAVAQNGLPSNAALEAMGLSGIQILSDSDAMAIRGMGYQPPHNPHDGGKDKPWSAASGLSYANVGDAGVHGDSVSGTGAGTIDYAAAEGKFMAEVSHGSEAIKTWTETHSLEIKGSPGTVNTTSTTIRVFSGGFAKASSL